MDVADLKTGVSTVVLIQELGSAELAMTVLIWSLAWILTSPHTMPGKELTFSSIVHDSARSPYMNVLKACATWGKRRPRSGFISFITLPVALETAFSAFFEAMVWWHFSTRHFELDLT